MGRPTDSGRFPAEGWRMVQRRQRKKENQWESKLETTFFVENLPEEASNRTLWRAFGGIGRLSDAYVAKKKDSSGNRFGFLRFLNVKEVNGILEKANGIRVLEAVVNVSLARFDKNHRKFNHLTEAPKVNMERNQTYAQKNTGGGNYTTGWRSSHGGRSYMEALKNQRPVQPERRTVRLTGEEGLLQKHWIGKAVIGDAKDVGSIMEVKKLMAKEGLQEAGVSYIGGLKMMIAFHDKKQALDFINNRRESWGEVFEVMRLWNGEEMPVERVVKLNIRGVPIQLRDEKAYNEIGGLFGKIVGRSEFSWGNYDVSRGSCTVVAKQWEKIDEVIEVMWRDRRFEVAVTEDGWEMKVGDMAGMEEGEFRFPSPENTENYGGNGSAQEAEKLEGEKSHVGKELHGKSVDFNARGGLVNEFNYEGGGENFSVGHDTVRRKKRRRAGYSPSPPKTQVDLNSVKNIGPFTAQVGLNGNKENGHLNCSGSAPESGNKVQEGETVGVSQDIEQEEATEEIIEESVMEIEEEAVGAGMSEAVAKEIDDTIKAGADIGIQLNGFRKEVEELVIGDGVYEVNQ